MSAVLRVAASVVVAVLLMAACSDGSGEGVAANAAQAGGGGWDMLAIEADEVEYFDSLAQMGKMADIVVIAQPTGVDGTRRVGPEGDEGIDLAQVRFEVIRPISDWDKDSIVLEFPVTSPEAYKALEEQVAGFPPAVLAVRDLGTVEPEKAGLYRLMNSESLWTEQPDGSGLVAPLAEEHQAPDESEAAEYSERAQVAGEAEAAGAADEAPGAPELPEGSEEVPDAPEDEDRGFAAELAEIKSLEALGDHLAAARRDCEGECGLSQAPWNR